MFNAPVAAGRRFLLATLLVLAVLAPSVGSATGEMALPAGSDASAAACTTAADPAAAATKLYGAGTNLVRTQTVAGMQTALVLEPRIAPGTRRRMLSDGTRWCDAASGFNQVWHN